MNYTTSFPQLLFLKLDICATEGKMISLLPEKSETEMGVEVEKGEYYKMLSTGVGGGKIRHKNRPVREN